jgi:OOP family OmpA-OmpF porin
MELLRLLVFYLWGLVIMRSFLALISWIGLISNCIAISFANANVLGIDIQNFNPTADQLDFFTVQSPRSLERGVWSLGFFFNYAKNNLLIYDTPIENQIKIDRSDDLTGADMFAAYGVSDHLQVAVEIPWYLSQNVDKEQYRKVFVTTGPYSLRTQVKYSVEGSKIDSGFAVLAAFDLPNVRNDPYTGLDAKPVTTLEASYGHIQSDFSVAGNIGYRIRSTGERPVDAPMFPLGDQFIYSLGMGFPLQQQSNHKKALSFIGELFGSVPVKKDPYKNTADISSLEGIIGLKGGFGTEKFWSLGAGTELLKDSLSPDWRLFAGINMYFSTVPHVNRDIILENAGQNESLGPMVAFKEDSDGDGIPDRMDDCPDTPKGVKVSARGCPADSDGDGVPDYVDKCPYTPKGEVVDRYGCSVIPDDDFDGVLNEFDQCPDTPYGKRVDKNGCALVRPQPAPIKIVILGDILFDFDRDSLKDSAKVKLTAEFNAIKSLNPKVIIIEGHTDSIGSEEYNRILSSKRAQTVKKLMLSSGLLDAKSIRAVGFGKIYPVAPNNTEEGRQKNRRVELKIYNQNID